MAPRSQPHVLALQSQWTTLGIELQRRSPAWLREGQRLLNGWSRWPRAYHDTHHLFACLQHLRVVQRDAPGALKSPSAVALALWFHDAIYWPWSAHNEARSAAWAAEFLRAQSMPEAFVESVYQHILDTRHTPGPLAGDAQWVVDIDLAILGQSPAVYDRFECHVRSEYAFVPRARYAAGRSAVLQSFLNRPRIYGTDWFHARYEAPARANLQRALAALDHRRAPTAPTP